MQKHSNITLFLHSYCLNIYNNSNLSKDHIGKIKSLLSSDDIASGLVHLTFYIVHFIIIAFETYLHCGSTN